MEVYRSGDLMRNSDGIRESPTFFQFGYFFSLRATPASAGLSAEEQEMYTWAESLRRWQVLFHEAVLG